MLFSYHIAEENGVEVLYFEGELIERTQANELIATVNELLEDKKLKFVFDLGNLKYMNSSGLNVLINLLTKARREGGEVVIVNVNKKITELLIITKLTSMFTVLDTKEQAIERLK